MDFIIWHYSIGLQSCLKTFQFLFGSVFHNFSFLTLIKTLFSPWKRMLAKDEGTGFNLQRFLENLSFNAISRGVGFCVRIILLILGIILTIVATLIGIILVLVWVVFPPVGVIGYLRYSKRHDLFIKKLIKKLQVSGVNQVAVVFDNEAGKFTVLHLSQTVSTFVSNAKLTKVLTNLSGVKTYAELIKKLVDNKVWSEDFLRSKEITSGDLVFAASWWDKIKIDQNQPQEVYYRRPGLGLELLYGYTPYLNQYAFDLSVPQTFSHHLIGREKVVMQMERVLGTGKSVILTGASGVGKKTVCLEFARRASLGQLGPEMSYRRILEFDYNSLLAGSADLNTKKTNLSSALEEASYAGNIILVIRDIHRLTNSQVEGYDFTDVFENFLEKKELKIIAISEIGDYERFIIPNLRMRNLFDKVEVTAPSKEDALLIIRDSAQAWEEKRKIIVSVSAIRRILEGSDKYVTDAPFPEKALDILDAVVELDEKEGDGLIIPDDVNAILSERTGISFSRLTEKEKGLLGNLEEVIHERLVNQETAVSLIAKSLRARTVGVTKEDRPVGSFLFLGPTGVGKTETARVLAKIYYGSEESIIRFDMAQYSGEDASERLIGSVRDGRPGDLSTAIKNRPASLLLLDEIEKGGRVVHNLLLTILDEGYLVDAFGKRINCKHLFIIGTSNAAAEYIRELVNSGITGERLQKLVVEFTLKKGLFYPEFLNRFDGVVVYNPLTVENLLEISRLMLNSLKNNLEKKGVYLDITNEVVKKLAVDGYEPSFGARPMRRIIDLTLGDLLGKAILKGEIAEGDRIKLVTKKGKEEFEWEKIS